MKQSKNKVVCIYDGVNCNLFALDSNLKKVSIECDTIHGSIVLNFTNKKTINLCYEVGTVKSNLNLRQENRECLVIIELDDGERCMMIFNPSDPSNERKELYAIRL